MVDARKEAMEQEKPVSVGGKAGSMAETVDLWWRRGGGGVGKGEEGEGGAGGKV
jgi:hypothetical protein